MSFTEEQIARMCHETNRTYCEMLGDNSQVQWQLAPQWQRDSCIQGVRFFLNNPHANPIDMHWNWVKDKTANGWIHGAEKNAALRTHPCMVEYRFLPEEQKRKDKIFISIIRAMTEKVPCDDLKLPDETI